MSLPSIAAAEARRLIERGAILVDIRDRDEFAREHIEQARSRPLSTLSEGIDAGGAQHVIFNCRSGMRTRAHAGKLAQVVACEAYILEGGLDAWKRAGLPVHTDKRQPLELMRQVQLAAGGAVLLGAVLGATLTPWFYLLCGAVGAGLMLAGATGFCGLARALQLMPWNRSLRT